MIQHVSFIYSFSFINYQRLNMISKDFVNYRATVMSANTFHKQTERANKALVITTWAINEDKWRNIWKWCDVGAQLVFAVKHIQQRTLLTDSFWRRQSEQSLNTLTPFNFLLYWLHVSALTGHPQVRYTFSYLKDYFNTTDPLHVCNLIIGMLFVVIGISTYSPKTCYLFLFLFFWKTQFICNL
jgi:hypothetical protein